MDFALKAAWVALRNKRAALRFSGQYLKNTLAQKLMAKRKHGQYTPNTSPTSKRRRVSRRVIKKMGKKNLFGMKDGESKALVKYVPRTVARYRRRRRPRNYGVQAGYGGMVTATRKGMNNRFDKFNRYGCVETRESLGNVTDADCVYIMNESVNTRDAIFYICGALLRKLFEKAGLRISGYNSAVVSNNAGTSNVTPYTVRMVSQNTVTGAVTNDDNSIAANESFGEVVNSFMPTFENYSAGFGRYSTSNSVELLKVVFYQGTDEPIVLSELYFNEVHVDILSQSDLKVQNRTQATGGSTDAENISNNPLQGRTYVFRGVPKPKANSSDIGGTNGALYPFERIGYPSGTSDFGGNTGGVGTDLKEPPLPKLFWNCYKSGGIRLEPGQIKQFRVVAKKSANILKMLKAMRLQMDSAIAPFSTYSVFPVQMIALEDVINANAAENISVQYEIQRTLGVKCWVKEKRYFRTHQRFDT